MKEKFEVRGIDPLPLACEASALPYELNPQTHWFTIRSVSVPQMRRGFSSNGRALALHARGKGIDTPNLHRFRSFSSCLPWRLKGRSDAMAERLRRWITNPLGFPAWVQIPLASIFFFVSTIADFLRAVLVA